MLPLTFKHGQLPPARDKATAERFDRGNNLLAIFRKHRLIVHRLQSYHVRCHVMLLPLTKAIADWIGNVHEDNHLVGAGERCRWDPETYALARRPFYACRRMSVHGYLNIKPNRKCT